MDYSKNYEVRRTFLKENLLNMKKEGFRVFINKPDEFRCSNYGIILEEGYGYERLVPEVFTETVRYGRTYAA